MALARPLDEVRVYSPTPAHREAFAQREGARSGLPVRAVGSAREAVEGADIVCTVTSSSTPVLEGAWLSPGTHVNAVGSSVRTARELDGEAVRRARFYVDRRESTLNESGDFLAARDEGLVDDDHIVAELGEVLDGRAPGRTDAAQITLFKGLGLAVEDLAAAHWVTARARAQGVGVEVPLGGRRHASD
ncbi:MAG: ornithine cyclodeaminase family protein [Gemmatimonadetes bacterium]|nr:MAG: ornithine cyclodeaminase family protein [Gemmatimonadota bacterium]